MPIDREAAVIHLRGADEVIGGVIDAVGPCALRPGARGDHFTTLLRAIVGQQLSGRAAEAIWQRLSALHADGRRIRPEDVLALPEARLRAVGLSGAKVGFVRDLAARVVSGELPLRRLGRQDDETVIAELVRVRGIGRWTAEMFLMFKLGRPDVWPMDDLGIRNAVKRLYGASTRTELEAVAEPWRPFRSVASWYLWRSLDVETV